MQWDQEVLADPADWVARTWLRNRRTRRAVRTFSQSALSHVDRPEGEIILDFNQKGQLLGIEIVGASALLSETTIARLRELEP